MWATGNIPNKRRCQLTSEGCVVLWTLSPGHLWKVCIQISLGGTTEHPLGKRASCWGTRVQSFFCFGTVSLVILGLCTWNPGPALPLWQVMAAAAQREWAGKEPDLGINYWLHLWRRRGRKEEYFSDHSSSLETNAFWELKLDVIFLSPARECRVWDLPLESGDSARIFILNLVVAKLFEIHLPHFFQWVSSNFLCVKTETVVQIF